jgi:hypothetical protein
MKNERMKFGLKASVAKRVGGRKRSVERQTPERRQARRSKGLRSLQELLVTVSGDDHFDERLAFRIRRDDGRTTVNRDLNGSRFAL